MCGHPWDSRCMACVAGPMRDQIDDMAAVICWIMASGLMALGLGAYVYLFVVHGYGLALAGCLALPWCWYVMTEQTARRIERLSRREW